MGRVARNLTHTMNRFSSIRAIIAGAAALVAGLATPVFGQGVTSSDLSGFVSNEQGQPLAGATVTAVHTPTNTTFRGVTGVNGRFSFTGIPVGGPYLVTASSDGYKLEPVAGVYTQLGANTDVALVAVAEHVVQLEKFNVVGEVNDLDSATAGAGTVLSNRGIEAVPTVNRSFADLMKTNPFVTVRAGQQIQALGMNRRFNTITLDGAKIDDSFGLNSTGLFSLNNPFSLDAIEQFSVSLTPYDIRQSGFAGAAMNAVSKSGTNAFHGTVYDLFTDSNWQGKDVSGSLEGRRQPLKERVYGFTLGGPILKDRLFFFINFEKFIRDSSPVSPAFTPDASFLDAVQARLAQLPGSPDLGTFGGTDTSRLSDTKRLIKLDWNIAQGHRLSVRYSDTIGSQPNTGSINAASFSQPFLIPGQPASFPNGTTSLSSNFYDLGVKERVWAAQLFSTWTPDLRTQFNYSNTRQDSVRVNPIAFPEVRILNVPGTSSAGAPISGDNAFRFGTEISSMSNELHVKTQTFGGSADYTWRAFTFTLGADHESSDYFNIFRQGSYGYFDYANLAAFQNDTPFGFVRSVVQSDLPLADISKFEQTGVFTQVRWDPTSRLNVTLGLRVDYLGSPIAPTENTAFEQAFGLTNAGTIDGTTAPAPRLSFNYALDRERTTQLRGGVGVFLGRNPWVWISNSYGGTGVGRFLVGKVIVGVPSLADYLGGTYADPDPAFAFDPANPVGVTQAGDTSGAAASISLIRPGMKLPTIQRANLAIDRKVPRLDAIFTVEYIDTRQLSALFVDNMNLTPTTVGADGRQRFAGSTSSAPLVHGFGNVIRTRDVRAGASQYLSFSLTRPFKDDWSYSLAYTHGHATEAQSLGSSTANSQWQFNGVFNQNQIEVARSDYEVRDRIQASISREFRIARDLATTVSLYYEGRSGMPYSYVYANDLNGDGLATDLIAVPTGPDDARFDFSGMSAVQQDAYFAFLKSSGLSRYAGRYASRNAFLTPWQNRLDLRVVQELPAYKQVKIELFADFLNFGSWLSRDLFNYVELLNTTATNSGQGRQLGTATYTADGRVRPGITLDANNAVQFASVSTIVPNNDESRWKIQGGIRLKF